MEVELTALFGAIRPRIFEVPISYYGRTYEEGKKIGFKDGLHAIYYIFYYNLFYLRRVEVRKHIQAMQELPALTRELPIETTITQSPVQRPPKDESQESSTSLTN
jgi:hypothetical protein